MVVVPAFGDGEVLISMAVITDFDGRKDWCRWLLLLSMTVIIVDFDGGEC